MEIISDVVIYIMMAFVLIGAVAAIRDDQNGLGKEFLQGIHSIGYLFIPVAGVMAALPYLSTFIEKFLGPIWSALGADPSMAATTFIATDMGGYQLAEATAHSNGDWITAMVTGYMAGATIVFSIPVGLAMLRRVDHKYMALGIMSGILTIPIGVVVTMTIILVTKATIRSEVSTTGAASTEISGLDWASLAGNMLPLVIIVALIAIAAIGVVTIFGDNIRLAAYRLDNDRARPGDTVRATLVWQALAPTETDLNLFVHLVDGSGRAVGQRDGPPLGGSFPTTTWRPGTSCSRRQRTS